MKIYSCFCFCFIFKLILLFNFNFNGYNAEECNTDKITDVSKEFLAFIDSDPTELFKNTANLLLNSVDGNTDVSTCDLNLKLDKIMNKLNLISDELSGIKRDIKCLKTLNMYSTVFSLMRNLANQGLQYFHDPSNNEAKNHIKKVCVHETEGITRIFSLFTELLEKKHVWDHFKNCLNYQSKNLILWKKEITFLALEFGMLGRLCAKVHLAADFYYVRFLSQVDEFVKYYSEITLIERFVDDEESGLSYWIDFVIKKPSISANDAAKKLDNTFSFFKWTVVFFKKDFYYDHEYYAQDETKLCGSRFFFKREDLVTNVLVSWCITDSFENSLLNIKTFENDAVMR